MKFINFLINVANGPYDQFTRLAACFCLLCMLAGFIGGFTVIMNGIYWSFKGWQFKRMLRRNRLGLV